MFKDGEGIRLLVGRDFTEAELALVREVVALFLRLSRKELAATLCEHLGWATPAGRLKVESCLELLLKLEAKGEIKLLPKTRRAKRKESAPLLSERTDPPSQELASFGNLSRYRIKKGCGFGTNTSSATIL